MILNAILALLFLSGGTAAFAGSGGGRLDFEDARFYAGYDVFALANSADEWKDNYDTAMHLLVNAAGYDSAEYSMTKTTGMGGRLGVRLPLEIYRDTYWGGSIGYVKGPSSETDGHAESTVMGSGTTNEVITTSYIRVLYEVTKSYPISNGNTRFSIGAGIGAAYGRIISKQTWDGSFVTVQGYPSSQKYEKKWTGFTWEISPSLTIPILVAELELGARLAGFPKLKKSGAYSEFAWNPIGFFAALHF